MEESLQYSLNTIFDGAFTKISVVSNNGMDEIGRVKVRPDRNIPDTIFVQDLMVIPEVRGQGLGRSLLRTAQTIIEGARTVRLEVESDNIPAVNLYKSEGYIVDAEVTSRTGKKYLRMKKQHK